MLSIRVKRGFTLLEVLLALSIFAVLAALLLSSMQTLQTSHAQISNSMQHWRDIELFWNKLQNDLNHVAPRPVRNQAGVSIAAMLGNPVLVQVDDANLALTRHNEGEQLALGAERIGYRLKDGRIEYLQWQGLDAAPRSVPTISVLFEQVTVFKLRYLDANGLWLDKWQPAQLDALPPRALEVTLQFEGQAPMQRLFLTP